MRPGESEWQSDALVGEASEGAASEGALVNGGLDGRDGGANGQGARENDSAPPGPGPRSNPGLTPIPKPYTWRAENLVDYARPLAIMLTSAFATFIMLYF